MLNKPYDKIVSELTNSLSLFDMSAIERLADAIVKADLVFLAGAGRSGLMMRCFAMRLMHMGFKTFVVGETTTTGISDQDLLIIGSGSGETEGMSIYAKAAKQKNAVLGLITIFPDSTIGKLADIKILISAPTSKKKMEPSITSDQPMGSLFEQSLLLLLDGLILILMKKININSEEMFKNHANLE